jgi:anaerobic selenocysteine-containing dehydrogenase
VDAALPGIGEAAVAEWLRKRLAPFPELTLERLAEGPVLAPGHQEVAFEDLRFPTPSGRIEILSEEAAARWGVDALPGWSEPAEAASTALLGDGRHPLRLMTPNTKNRIHSQFGNLDMIRAHDPAPVVRVSPADALPRGIREGDRVRVFNDRGFLEVPCTLDFGILAGCACLTNGWWIADGGTVNLLSAGRETDMGHGAAFHDNRVELERA